MEIFSRIYELIQSGGFVAWPLLGSMIVLWYCVLVRYSLVHSTQRSEFKESLEEFKAQPYSRERMEIFFIVQTDLHTLS